MAKKPTNAPKPASPEPIAPEPVEGEAAQKRRRNVIFVSLDDIIEARLQEFIDSQRVRPDRAAVALTALIEFLDRVDRD